MSRIRQLVGHDLTVTLDRMSTTLTVVDWPELVRTTQELATAAHGLPPGERDRLIRSTPDPATEIYEYFLGDLGDLVESGDLLPFGLLGLTADADGFAEESHDGVLLLDVREADAEDAPVLWLPLDADETLLVADRLADLAVAPA